MSDIKKLVTLSSQFAEAVNRRIQADPSLQQKIINAISQQEHQAAGELAMEIASEGMMGAMQGKSEDALLAALGPKIVRATDLTAEYTLRVLPESEVAAMVPASARNAATAGEFKANGAPTLAKLCLK